MDREQLLNTEKYELQNMCKVRNIDTKECLAKIDYANVCNKIVFFFFIHYYYIIEYMILFSY